MTANKSPGRLKPVIRQAALDMFATRGFEGTSVRDIASAVGVQPASLYNHYSSKEEILWDITRISLEDLHAAWASRVEAGVRDLPAAEQLKEFVRTHVRYHAERKGEAVIVNAQLSRLSDMHRDAAVASRRAYEDILIGLVLACSGRDTVTPELRLRVFAILQMATGVSNWFDKTGPVSAEEVAMLYAELAVKMTT